MLKKTKIVATLGPVSANEKTLSAMVRAGLNVVRFNFSHETRERHAENMTLVRRVSKKLGVPIAILQDLSGPKIRIGDFKDGRVELKKGEKIVLTTSPCEGTAQRVFVNYKRLPQDIRPGKFILLDDGKKKLRVDRITKTDIHCTIIVGGDTKGRRGVNLPGTHLRISSITAKDRQDLEMGIREHVDFVALSFVRRVEDVIELRGILQRAKSKARIIVKIETDEAIEHLDEIIEAADGVMVARGDLAVEVPMEQVPFLQKRIIRQARQLGKPAIVATQMLESMINAPVPTRAEVSDVANSILDGTDAIMLSEETTLGKYPVETIAMMTRIACEVEEHYADVSVLGRENLTEFAVVDAVTHAVIRSAREVDAKLIVALSESGSTPRMVARHRPHCPILALTPSPMTLRQLTLSFGCYSLLTPGHLNDVDQVIMAVRKIVLAKKLAKRGECIVIVAGVPFGKAGATNMQIVITL
ncbi:MAG: pyruvate kinase [Candidatus Moraniibacteriota bacterium]